MSELMLQLNEPSDKGSIRHLGNFADPLMDCKECHERFSDKPIEDYMAGIWNGDRRICGCMVQ